jgi:hypothetical protein
MNATIPLAESEEQAARVGTDIRESLAKELGVQFDDRQVQSLRYDHGRHAYHADVGRTHALNGEPVIAILYERERDLYHIVTSSRGAVSGTPILVGAWIVGGVTWLD